jgi:hypothetical protein
MIQIGVLTASGQSVSAAYASDQFIMVSISGTYSAGLAVVMEISEDGINYGPWPGVTLGALGGQEGTRTLLVNESRQWVFTGGQLGTNFRIRSTAWPSPTGTANVTIMTFGAIKVYTVLQNAAVATGNGTAMPVDGLSGVGVQISGITTATITFEGTIDGTNWVALESTNLNTGVAGTTATTNGLYFVPTTGLIQFRARISSWTSGTITATGVGVQASVGVVQASIAAVVSENITQWGGVAVTGGLGASTAGSPRVVISTDNTGPVRLEDGTSSQLVTIAQQHLSDNVTQPASGGALLTSGPSQVTNYIGNASRLRQTGADQASALGVQSGVTSMGQEFLTTSTTTVAAAAGTATINVTTTVGLNNVSLGVDGTVTLEPFTTNAEQAEITALTATSITIAFPAGGAKFTHTQPYTIQSYFFNIEKDFSGEGQNTTGIGAAIATEFESNSGGPALASGLPSGLTLDADRNLQGKGSANVAITSTVAADANLVFTANPWTAGLVIGQAIILSVGANGAAIEMVTVSKNNSPATGASLASRTVKLVNPVVNTGSTFATFDIFALSGPGSSAGASLMGIEDSLIYVYDPSATDPKRPLFALQGTSGHAATLPPNISAAGSTQALPINLFEMTPNQAGVTQQFKLFPTTIAITGGLPAIGGLGGTKANLTNAGNVCGGIFSPDPRWDSVLLEFAEVGGADDTQVIVEIGRLKAAGAVPEILASVTLNASGNTVGATTTNPFTGLGGHASVTWRFFDTATLAANLSQLGDVLVANGGQAVDAEKPTLSLSCHDVAYYYVLITTVDGTMTNVLCTMTPKS